MLDISLSNYYKILLERQSLIEETGELHNQNEELKNLLNQYLHINHELIIPPTKLIKLDQVWLIYFAKYFFIDIYNDPLKIWFYNIYYLRFGNQWRIISTFLACKNHRVGMFFQRLKILMKTLTCWVCPPNPVNNSLSIIHNLTLFPINPTNFLAINSTRIHSNRNIFWLIKPMTYLVHLKRSLKVNCKIDSLIIITRLMIRFNKNKQTLLTKMKKNRN